jgi:hypothetical protein
MQQGFLLTDNFYGVPGQGFVGGGRSLWVPELAVGRLVEEPGDMQAVIEAFLQDDTIPVQDVLVTGYDFLSDSSNLISATVSSWNVSTQTNLINDEWTVGDLAQAWTNYAPGRDLVSVNAHFEPWRALPAYPSHDYDSGDLFYNFYITESGYLADSLTFSMGCHAGLNLPDGDVDPVYTDQQGQPFVVNPDFPQALAQKGSCMVANTGYGYGVDDSPEYSEWLMQLYARFLGQRHNVPVGEALRQAKERYIGSAPSAGLSIYHEKALLEATLYGLPMLKVDVPHPQPVTNRSIQAEFTPHPAQRASTALLAPTTLSVTLDLSPSLRSTGNGDYFALDSEIQASPGRPVQPRASLPLSSTVGAGLKPHGVLLWSAAFDDYADFDPFISRPVSETAQAEPDLQVGAWLPAKGWALNRFGDSPRLVVVGGQFSRDDGAENENDLGVERVYSSMELRPYYSDQDDDYLPPVIWDVTRSCRADQLQVAVETEDESGIHAVVVTHRPPAELEAPAASGSWSSFELSDGDGDGVWTGALPVSNLETCLKISFFVQAVDEAGNVQMSGNKGRFFKAPADPSPEPEPTYRGQIAPAASALSSFPGSTVTYNLQVTNSGDLSDTFDVSLSHTWPTTVSLSALGPLSPGLSAELEVMVHIPRDAQVGLADTATITITSRGDKQQSASATLTTSAGPYKLFLPLLTRRP